MAHDKVNTVNRKDRVKLKKIDFKETANQRNAPLGNIEYQFYH